MAFRGLLSLIYRAFSASPAAAPVEVDLTPYVAPLDPADYTFRHAMYYMPPAEFLDRLETLGLISDADVATTAIGKQQLQLAVDDLTPYGVLQLLAGARDGNELGDDADGLVDSVIDTLAADFAANRESWLTDATLVWIGLADVVGGGSTEAKTHYVPHFPITSAAPAAARPPDGRLCLSQTVKLVNSNGLLRLSFSPSEIVDYWTAQNSLGHMHVIVPNYVYPAMFYQKLTRLAHSPGDTFRLRLPDGVGGFSSWTNAIDATLPTAAALDDGDQLRVIVREEVLAILPDGYDDVGVWASTVDVLEIAFTGPNRLANVAIDGEGQTSAGYHSETSYEEALVVEAVSGSPSFTVTRHNELITAHDRVWDTVLADGTFPLVGPAGKQFTTGTGSNTVRTAYLAAQIGSWCDALDALGQHVDWVLADLERTGTTAFALSHRWGGVTAAMVTDAGERNAIHEAICLAFAASDEFADNWSSRLRADVVTNFGDAYSWLSLMDEASIVSGAATDLLDEFVDAVVTQVFQSRWPDCTVSNFASHLHTLRQKIHYVGGISGGHAPRSVGNIVGGTQSPVLYRPFGSQTQTLVQAHDLGVFTSDYGGQAETDARRIVPLAEHNATTSPASHVRLASAVRTDGVTTVTCPSAALQASDRRRGNLQCFDGIAVGDRVLLGKYGVPSTAYDDLFEGDQATGQAGWEVSAIGSPDGAGNVVSISWLDDREDVALVQEDQLGTSAVFLSTAIGWSAFRSIWSTHRTAWLSGTYPVHPYVGLDFEYPYNGFVGTDYAKLLRWFSLASGGTIQQYRAASGGPVIHNAGMGEGVEWTDSVTDDEQTASSDAAVEFESRVPYAVTVVPVASPTNADIVAGPIDPIDLQTCECLYVVCNAKNGRHWIFAWEPGATVEVVDDVSTITLASGATVTVPAALVESTDYGAWFHSALPPGQGSDIMDNELIRRLFVEAPAGPIARPADVLRNMVAGSGRFRAQLGRRATTQDVLARIHRPNKTLWDHDGFPSAARPFAVIQIPESGVRSGQADAPFGRASDGRNIIHHEWTLELMLCDDDRAPGDLQRSTEIFETFAGQVLEDILSMAGKPGRLNIDSYEMQIPPQYPPPERQSAGWQFWLCKFTFEIGVM